MNTTTGWRARTILMAALANNIYSTNRRFKVPSGIVSVEVEKYTVPLQLPSANTPANMRMVELFKEGNEPTEVSQRYAKLESPSNGKSKLTGNQVSLSWDAIKTPSAVDTESLLQYFNDNYGVFASKYYEKRITENNETFGQLGYNIYKKDKDGTLTSLGWTSNTQFVQTVEPNTNYTFVVNASYEKFKELESKSLEIKVKTTDIVVDDDSKPSNNDNKPSSDDKKHRNTGLD